MSKDLPLDELVVVNLKSGTAAVKGKTFNNALLIGAQTSMPPAIDGATAFDSYEGIATVFGTDNEITKSAEILFGQKVKPTRVTVALRKGKANPDGSIPTDAPPSGGSKVFGGLVQNINIATWNKIADGSFSFTYNDILISINNLDFSNIKSVYDIVDIVNTHFNSLDISNEKVSLALHRRSSKLLNPDDGSEWKNEDGNVWNEVDGEAWYTYVEPTGEISFGYDPTSRSFYAISNRLDRDFGTFGAAKAGTDISVDNLLNMKEKLHIYRSDFKAKHTMFTSSYAITPENLTALKKIKTGSFSINTVDGLAQNTHNITDLDFSHISAANDSFEAMALLVMNNLKTTSSNVNFGLDGDKIIVQGYDSSFETLKIGKAVSGTKQVGVDISTLLFGATPAFTKRDNFMQTPMERYLEAVEEAGKTGTSFYGICSAKAKEDEVFDQKQVLDLAGSVQAVGLHIYYAYLDDQRAYTSSQDDIVTKMVSKNFYRTVPVLVYTSKDGYLDAGCAANELGRTPGSYTLMFKSISGDVQQSDASRIEQTYAIDKRANLYSEIGGVGMIREGTVCSQNPEFSDNIRAMDWFTNLIQTLAVDGQIRREKTPYTNAGCQLIILDIKPAFDLAVKVGFIAPPSIKDGTVIPSYRIWHQDVSDVTPAQKASRTSPQISFDATVAGAINKIFINGTLV